jgi:Domain of unknown function (DUF4407)
MSVLLSVAIVLALGVVGDDVWGWIPALSRLVIRLSSRLAPRDRRDGRLQTLAERYDERHLTGLLWSVASALVSLGMSLAALVVGFRRRGPRRPSSSYGRARRTDWTAWAAIGVSAAAVTLSSVVALRDMMTISLLYALGVGLLLGLTTAAVNLMTLPAARGGWAATLAAAMPGLLVAALLTFFCASPILLQVFQPEVQAQLISDRVVATQVAVSRATAAAQPEIMRLEDQTVRLYGIAGRSSYGAGPLDRRPIAYPLRAVEGELRAARQGAHHDRLEAVRSVRRRYDGVLVRLVALQEVRSSAPEASYLAWAIQFLLFLVYACPGLALLARRAAAARVVPATASGRRG